MLYYPFRSALDVSASTAGQRGEELQVDENLFTLRSGTGGCPASFRAMRSTDWIAWKFASKSSVASLHTATLESAALGNHGIWRSSGEWRSGTLIDAFQALCSPRERRHRPSDQPGGALGRYAPIWNEEDTGRGSQSSNQLPDDPPAAPG